MKDVLLKKTTLYETMRDRNLTPEAKVIFVYMARELECEKQMPDRATMLKHLGLTKERFFKHFGILQNEGYVTFKGDIAKYEQCKKEVLKKEGDKVCEWCGGKTHVLHEHHYPIPRSKGGTETVSICPNCHYEFHYLEKGGIK